ADDRHRREIGQALHLHAVAVALDHEHQLAMHGNAIGPVVLAEAVAALAHRLHEAAVIGVVHHQGVALLGGGDDPAAAVGPLPDGDRVDLVARPGRGDETLRHRHRGGTENLGHGT